MAIAGCPDRAGALERALELIELTLDDPRHRASPARLREFCRMREVLLDYLVGANEYGSTERDLQRYFDVFAAVATRRPGDARGEESAPQR